MQAFRAVRLLRVCTPLRVATPYLSVIRRSVATSAFPHLSSCAYPSSRSYNNSYIATFSAISRKMSVFTRGPHTYDVPMSLHKENRDKIVKEFLSGDERTPKNAVDCFFPFLLRSFSSLISSSCSKVARLRLEAQLIMSRYLDKRVFSIIYLVSPVFSPHSLWFVQYLCFSVHPR